MDMSDPSFVEASTTSGVAAGGSSTLVPDRIPKHLLPLTPQEQSLIDLFAKVKQFEKEAAKAAANAAKAKLDAANEEYHQNQLGRDQDQVGNGDDELKPKKRKRKRKQIEQQGSGMDEDEIDESEYSDSDESDDGLNELERLRREKEAADKKREKEMASIHAEEEMRKQHLEEESNNISTDFGPSLNKRKKTSHGMYDDDTGGGLIDNMQHLSTPPHDFSKTLAMSKVSGSQLFPDPRSVTPDKRMWTPPQEQGAVANPTEECLELELSDFDSTKLSHGNGKNTIAIKFNAPSDSKRFSINIAEKDNDNYHSVLFHFNPRQFERGGQVVVNDKKTGMWGQGINIPLSTMPLMFGEVSCTLIIQITGEGFDVFLNGKHCARLEHRTPLPSPSEGGNSLILQFPSTDDYGTPENWIVYKVWFGHKALMASTSSSDLDHVPGVNSHNSVHEKKLFVRGLPKLHSQPEIELRIAELERAFRKYGGAQGATVICPTNSTFAFVELETGRMADLALREMGGKYRLNRARRSRHEALLEQRAAGEAAGKGGNITRETSGWD